MINEHVTKISEKTWDKLALLKLKFKFKSINNTIDYLLKNQRKGEQNDKTKITKN